MKLSIKISYSKVVPDIQRTHKGRGVRRHEFGPKTLDELRNEQSRLQKWSAKFSGANRILREEVETLKGELQRAYETDPLKTGNFITRDAYNLVRQENSQLKEEVGRLLRDRGAFDDKIRHLKSVSTTADEERHASLRRAVDAAEDVARLKVQLEESNRTAMQKHGAVQDLGDRLSELQNRYDILGHHVLQLGEEKTSLMEALRERQSQLDFCLAQLQILGRDAKAREMLEERLKNMQAEQDRLRMEREKEIAALQKELTDCRNALKDCCDARSKLSKELEDCRARLSSQSQVKPDASRLGGALSSSRPDSSRLTSSAPLSPTSSNVSSVKSSTKSGARPRPVKATDGDLLSAMKAKLKSTDARKTEKLVQKVEEAPHKEKAVKKTEIKPKVEERSPIKELPSVDIISKGKEDTNAYQAKNITEVLRHRGLVIRVRWHTRTGKHTYGSRHLHVDSEAKTIGWSRGKDDKVGTSINFSDIKRLAYGYESNMMIYKRNYDCPSDAQDPQSASGGEDDLVAPPVGPPKGALAQAPRIALSTCFSIITTKGDFDFYTATESETFDWILKLSRVFKAHSVEGLHDRKSFLIARGWTRLIEQCCIRQTTRRQLFIEGMERAAVFAATTGLGSPGGLRSTGNVSATKTGTGSSKVFRGGGGRGFQGLPSPAQVRTTQKKAELRVSPGKPPEKTKSSTGTGGKAEVQEGAKKDAGGRTTKSAKEADRKASQAVEKEGAKKAQSSETSKKGEVKESKLAATKTSVTTQQKTEKKVAARDGERKEVAAEDGERKEVESKDIDSKKQPLKGGDSPTSKQKEDGGTTKSKGKTKTPDKAVSETATVKKAKGGSKDGKASDGESKAKKEAKSKEAAKKGERASEALKIEAKAKGEDDAPKAKSGGKDGSAKDPAKDGMPQKKEAAVKADSVVKVTKKAKVGSEDKKGSVEKKKTTGADKKAKESVKVKQTKASSDVKTKKEGLQSTEEKKAEAKVKKVEAKLPKTKSEADTSKASKSKGTKEGASKGKSADTKGKTKGKTKSAKKKST